MRTPVPVLSPLLSYDRRGAVASKFHRNRRNPLSVRCLRYLARPRTQPFVSRDLSLHPHPTQPRTFPAPLIRRLPLLACLTGCAAIREETLPQYFVLTLPASIGVFVATAVILMYLALLGGFVWGERNATTLLRAADSAAAKYHRQQIAALLDASSAIHDLTEDIVLRAHCTIDDLRTQLEHLKKAQR